MKPAALLHELLLRTAESMPQQVALRGQGQTHTYSQLAAAVDAVGAQLVGLGLPRGSRVAVYLEKRVETVLACFGAAAAGCVFVPVNPLLKPAQVGHVLQDSGATLLVTSEPRLQSLGENLSGCQALRHLVLVDLDASAGEVGVESGENGNPWKTLPWDFMVGSPAARPCHLPTIDTDPVAILYTSGSTGKPKGVVLSHRNMVAGALSVAGYLGNGPQDVLLAVLPLSFDAGFSQLTTAFASGATVVLLNHLLPRDVVQAMARERITGLTAVPPLYMQLAALDWPAEATAHLRYFANTGGHMPQPLLAQLRARAPRAAPFLMYGLTEAFRSTYLPPSEVDLRPDSMGQAIPNAEILVLRPDGSPCAPEEPGELVHRGPLVALGYWGDREKTAERFRVLPPQSVGADSRHQLALPEIAVFSGDTVRRDHDGFLYFIGRADAMIKTSGYRVSPQEIEEVVLASGSVTECAAVGLPDPKIGQSIVVFAQYIRPQAAIKNIANETTQPGSPEVAMTVHRMTQTLLAHCRAQLPAYMVPADVVWSDAPLPRNANGKIDRLALVTGLTPSPASEAIRPQGAKT